MLNDAASSRYVFLRVVAPPWIGLQGEPETRSLASRAYCPCAYICLECLGEGSSLRGGRRDRAGPQLTLASPDALAFSRRVTGSALYPPTLSRPSPISQLRRPRRLRLARRRRPGLQPKSGMGASTTPTGATSGRFSPSPPFSPAPLTAHAWRSSAHSGWLEGFLLARSQTPASPCLPPLQLGRGLPREDGRGRRGHQAEGGRGERRVPPQIQRGPARQPWKARFCLGPCAGP